VAGAPRGRQLLTRAFFFEHAHAQLLFFCVYLRHLRIKSSFPRWYETARLFEWPTGGGVKSGDNQKVFARFFQKALLASRQKLNIPP